VHDYGSPAGPADELTSLPWSAGELVGLDFETTGVDRCGDVPVSFAIVRVVSGVVIDRLAGLVDPGREIPPAATAIHGITTERARAAGRPLAEVLPLIAEHVVHAGRRGIPVVGMNVSYDLTMLDHHLRLLEGDGLAGRGWSGPVLDVLVLDRHFDRYRRGKRKLEHLCQHYSVAVKAPHDAGADAEAAIAVLGAICGRYPELHAIALEELTRLQCEWHREWAEHYDLWRRGNGQRPLDPGDFEWPLAPRPAAAAPAAV
jgi:DNA polymerase-3 subunit epsilon